MNIPIPKLKAIILYFGTHTNNKFLGKVKLMKLFYFLDFMHVKKYGTPITYDTYIHLEHGPIPSAIKNLVDSASDDVENASLADTISFETPTGTNMQRVIPARDFIEKDKKYFSPTELEVLEQICSRFGEKNTKYTEEASHNEAPWKETKFLEQIPYTLAAKDGDCVSSEEEIALSMKI